MTQPICKKHLRVCISECSVGYDSCQRRVLIRLEQTRDGLLVLKNVVDVGHVDHLRQVMSAETQTILNHPQRAGMYNQGVNSNILQFPPVHREDCLFDDVWFNPFVVQVANA